MSYTIIRDPEMEPFHISKDNYCYTVIETITPEEKNLGKFGNAPKKQKNLTPYEKPVGHYGTLASALKRVAKSKLDQRPEYDSVLSYIKEFELQNEKMDELLTKIGI